MQGTRAVWALALSILFAFTQTVLTKPVNTTAPAPIPVSCPWYCKIQHKLEHIQDQLDRLTAKLLPDDCAHNHPHSCPTKVCDASNTCSPILGTTVSAPTSTATPIVTPPKAVDLPKSIDEIMGGGKGYRSVAYWVNWGIYGRKYPAQDIPVDKLTHVLYAFADNREDGTVILTDSWADCDIRYPPGDTWNDCGKNLYGALKQMYLHKKANRNLKTLLSIGGWTYTQERKHLDGPASTPEGRKKFADSCVTLIRDFGFDGIDVDWEYPNCPEQGQQLLLLLREIRAAMDAYAETLDSSCGEKPHFLLSIAAPAGEQNYRNYPLKEIAHTLDFINLMAYDFAGSWDRNTGHLANINHSVTCPTCTPFNAHSVIHAYVHNGVPCDKIVLGMPLYGRVFQQTTGMGSPFTGIGSNNEAEYSFEAGVYDFKALPRAGATEHIDEDAMASYSFNPATGELISYDNIEIARRKAQYIRGNGLGGAMWWELSGDRKIGEGSLVEAVVDVLGGHDGGKLEQKQNWLKYPDSCYDNVREGCPNS